MPLALVVVLLFSLPSILCQPKHQTSPLHFDLATINQFRQYQNFTSLDVRNKVHYTITLAEISAYMSSLRSNTTTTCELEFGMLIEAALRLDMWALKVIDAWGKPLPSGILKGNIFWTGNYDECVQPLYLPGNKSFVQQPFDTQHCTLYPTLSVSQLAAAQDIILGLCVPASCDRQSLAFLVRAFFNNSNITEDYLVCSNDPPNGQKGFTPGAIISCLILSLLAFVVLVGTVIDLILTPRLNSVGSVVTPMDGHDDQSDAGVMKSKSTTLPGYSRFSIEETLNRTSHIVFIAEFSAARTLRHIFTVNRKADANSFPFINGVRVLALFWVIIGHSFLNGTYFSSNIVDVLAWSRNPAFQLISNATLSVDTFFVLSGFLTATLFVRQVNKEKTLSWRLMVMYYVHRYIRLTPLFILIVMIQINLTPYFGHGPMYPSRRGFESDGCRNKYWWTSLLYVGNLVHPDQMCMTISWYLHNDMQFYWIAPLVLIPFVIGQKIIAFTLTIIFVLVGIGSTLGILLYYPDMPLGGIESVVAMITPGPSYFKSIYVAPWCRISTYAIGLLTGFVINNTGRTHPLNIFIKIIGTLLAIIIGLTCIFAMSEDNVQVPGLNRSSIIAYQSLFRTGWGLAIAWLLFLCCTNQGGIVNKILSSPIWFPLARLNYSAYLIHVTIIYITVFSRTVPNYYQPHVVINNFVSNLFFSYVAAIVVHIFLETPFFVLEKKFLKR